MRREEIDRYAEALVEAETLRSQLFHGGASDRPAEAYCNVPSEKTLRELSALVQVPVRGNALAGVSFLEVPYKGVIFYSRPKEAAHG